MIEKIVRFPFRYVHQTVLPCRSLYHRYRSGLHPVSNREEENPFTSSHSSRCLASHHWFYAHLCPLELSKPWQRSNSHDSRSIHHLLRAFSYRLALGHRMDHLRFVQRNGTSGRCNSIVARFHLLCSYVLHHVFGSSHDYGLLHVRPTEFVLRHRHHTYIYLPRPFDYFIDYGIPHAHHLRTTIRCSIQHDSAETITLNSSNSRAFFVSNAIERDLFPFFLSVLFSIKEKESETNVTH